MFFSSCIYVMIIIGGRYLMKKIFLFCLTIVFVSIAAILIYQYYPQKEDKIDITFSVSKYDYDDILMYQDGYFLVKNHDSYQIINEQNQFIDTIDYAYHEISLLQKGFYVDKTLDGEYLKRNGTLVSKLPLEEEPKLYKQEDTFIYYTNYPSYLEDGIVNFYHHDIEKITSFLFSLETGEKIKEFAGEIKPLKKGYYFVNEEEKSYLIKEEKFYQNDCIILDNYSDNYILAKQNERYGLLDYEGNIIVDFLYDEILFHNQNLFVVKKDGMYAVINSSLKEIIPFQYERIDLLENYFITYHNNQIEIFDAKGSFLDLSYSVTEYFKSREFGRTLVISLENGENSYVIVDQNKEKFMLNLKDQVDIIENTFLAIHTVNKDNSNTITIYDQNFQKLGVFKVILNGPYVISRVNENIFQLTDEEKTIYLDIEDQTIKEEILYEVKKLDDNYLYYVDQDYIYLLDQNYHTLLFLEGVDLEKINHEYYKVQNKNGKYSFVYIRS